MKSNHADTEERRLAVSRNAGSTKSAFAPRKHARSRSERRLSPEVILPAFPMVVPALLTILTTMSLGCPVPCSASEDDSRWVHPLCQPLPIDRNGPFVELADGSLMTVDIQGTRVSKDDGKTWSEAHPICEGVAGLRDGHEPATVYFVRTTSGVLVAVYLDSTTYNFSWDNSINQPKDDCRLEVWAVRSLDGGKTWTDRQRLLEGYNPNFFGFIQHSSGRLVAVVPHIVLDPGRYAACSLTSDNDGKTWKRSNLIDLGGHGHHSGAMEPSVAELNDGRLLMVIRTHWGRFWEALSDDGGLSWRTIRPTQIESSSSPGYLLRLRSGRLVLVSNGKVGRQELLIAFSEDDGKSWTRQIVLARQNGGQLSYPYVFERRAGELWAIAGFAYKKGWKEPLPLTLTLNEKDLLRETKETP